MYVYASMLADQDTRDAAHQGMRQEMVQLAAAFAAEAAYIEPEMLRADKATLERFLAAEPRLQDLSLLPRRRRPPRRAHAERDRGKDPRRRRPARRLAGRASTASSSNADFPYPTVTLSDGRTVKLDQAAFAGLRALPNRADREKVMSAFFAALGGFSRTFGTTMNGEVQKVLFFAKARKYPIRARDGARRSEHPGVGLHAARRRREPEPAGVPPLSEAAQADDRARPAALLRSLRAARRLGEARILAGGGAEAVLDAVAPLGAEYQATIQRAFKERWIDLLPNDGKRSGAYSNGGAYDVHPYMLINFNGKYDDVSTLAHELGHTMQSYFSNKTQPYPLAGYPTVRRRGRVDLQRVAAHRPRAEEHQGRRHAAVAAGQLSREHQGHGLPPDAVRRVRAADARDGGEGAADHRRRARQAVSGHHQASTTATIRALRSSTTTSPTSGATSRTSTATSTSSSTPPRSWRPRRWRRR